MEYEIEKATIIRQRTRSLRVAQCWLTRGHWWATNPGWIAVGISDIEIYNKLVRYEDDARIL